MIVFGIVAALVTAGVLLAVVPALAGTRAGRGATCESAVAAVCRDHLRELERDLAGGLIDRERYAEARADVERRLLSDAVDDVERAPPRRARGSRTAWAVGAFVPLAAAVVYALTGTPQVLAPRPPAEAAHATDAGKAQAMIARLAARLEREPDNAEAWVMLARSYGALKRFPEAARAYAQAAARVPPDAQLYADYADAVAMAQGRRLRGEPEALIARALAADPGHVKALSLAGSAAFEKRDYEMAIAHWQRLLTRVPGDADIARSVRGSIAQAQDRVRAATGANPP